MTLTAEVTRDENGVPVHAFIFDGGKQILELDNSALGWTIEGSRRDLTPTNLALLRLLLPLQEKAAFTIPQPLSVVQNPVGSILLFDDMETLLKWGNVAGAGVALDNALAYNGDQSLQVTNAAPAVSTYASRTFPFSPSESKTFSGMFNPNDATLISYMDFHLYYWLAGVNYTLAVRWNRAATTLSYYRRGAGWTDLDTAFPNFNSNTWHKFSFSFNRSHYLNLSMNGYEYEAEALGEYDRETIGAVQTASIALTVARVGAADAIANYDDIMVKEET